MSIQLPRPSTGAVSLVVCLSLALAACDAPVAPRDLQSVQPALARGGRGGGTKVARVTVSYVSGTMDTATWTIPVGGTARFAATAYDASNAVVSSSGAVFRSTSVGVMKVDSIAGTASALAAGSGAVTATVAGVTGTSRSVTVVAPPPPPPPPVVTTGAIALQVVRFDGGSGAATVSAGIPLAPGALRPGSDTTVRVYVGGTEHAAYVESLHGLHADGSVRAVLVQFRVASLGATSLTGDLAIGAARPAAMRLANRLVTPGAIVSGTPAGLPQAAALPSDPDYLVATDLVGGTTTAAVGRALGASFLRYENDFVTYADKHWALEGAAWSGNYYDRALIYYAFWARTGNAQYWARAGQIAYDYRTKYLEANAYGSSPHWAQLEGLEKHFLLTGDDASRQAVGRTAGRLYSGFNNSAYLTRVNGESRIAARLLHAQLLSWRLSTATTALAGVSQATWGTQVESIFDQIAAWQQPDGSFPADGQICGGQLNYMVGLQNDALIKMFEQYVPATTSRATLQTRARTIVTKAVDYMWGTQWLPTNRAFKYASVDCSSKNVGGPSPAPDLNNMISPSVAWVYAQTRDIAYLSQADQIFAGGVTQAFLAGTKQFNENYTASFRYLGYR